MHGVGGAVLMEILAVLVDVERRLAAACIDLRQGRIVERAGVIVRVGTLRRLLVPLAGRGFEQGVLLDLLGDEALDLEVAEREQADRLLQLRRHHQRLRLP